MLVKTTVIIEETYQTSITEVWKAITEPDHMKQWFFEQIDDFKAEPGFETQFLVENEGRKFTHLWKVIKVIPQKKIVYDWQYKEWEGVGEVTFELFEENNFTRLILTNTGLETFTADIPEFKKENCVGGWRYFIKGRLKEFLGK